MGQKMPLVVLGVILVVAGVMLTGVWSTDGKSTARIIGGVAVMFAGLAAVRLGWRRRP